MKYLFYLLLCTSLLFSCGNENENPPETANCESNNRQSTNRIWPLGASRVEGNRPDYESFRYDLWLMLNQENITFDFIGTACDEGAYPSSSFDRNHQGHGGWTSGELLNNLDNWLNIVGAPDFVLFSSPGGNDALEDLSIDQAIQNINAIVDKIQAVNEKVTIIIEQMAPGNTELMNESMQLKFEQIHQAVNEIANEKSNPQSQVIVVDMYEGFRESYLADEVHYNSEGALFIAQKYFDTLLPLLEK